MPAVDYTITLEENADFDLKVKYQDETCSVINVTGYGAQMEVKNSLTGPSLLTASVSNGRITLSGVSGIFNINFPVASIDALTSLITPRTARYDLFIWPTAASSNVDPVKLLKGRVKYDYAISTP